LNDNSINARNPMGIKLTQEQKDESFRQGYWGHAINYGLQYYVAGRFATANGFVPVCANLLHHAVELLLKACLSYDDSLETIDKYGYKNGGYSHDILLLWDEFKRRQSNTELVEYDEIIRALHEFEDIGYPEKLIKKGASILINIFDVEPNSINSQGGERSYCLMLPQIDHLVGLLFKATHANPEAFLHEITDERGMGSKYYQMIKETLFGRAPERGLPACT
jgi:hypothetical protein